MSRTTRITLASALWGAALGLLVARSVLGVPDLGPWALFVTGAAMTVSIDLLLERHQFRVQQIAGLIAAAERDWIEKRRERAAS